MKYVIRFSIIVLVCMVMAVTAYGDINMPSIFSNHMVLQRNMADTVWGWTSPGQAVMVSFAGHVVKTTADTSGRWQLKLPAMKASKHGRDLIIKSDKKTLIIHDVVVGEVWLCSGQSNMVFKLSRAFGGKQAAAQANYPSIRIMDVANKKAYMPQKDFVAKWQVAIPKAAEQFSAVAYFFALELHGQLHVPIGIIKSAWSGTHIQPWIARNAYQNVPQLGRSRKLLQSYDLKWHNILSHYLEQIKVWVNRAKQDLKQNKAIPDQPEMPQNPITKNYDNPTVLYNAMIAPMTGYGMRGVVWYQGAGNVNHHPKYYFYQLPALIHGWRENWGKRGGSGMFPFVVVQVAPWSGYHGPVMKVWAAELHASRSIPNVGIIGTMDIGSQKTIHPRNKKAVGRRLMLWTMANVYGKKDLVYCGPRFALMQVHGNRAIIQYKHIGSGLSLRNDQPLEWFEIAGRNGKFVRAKAKIKSDTVVVYAEQVKHPVAVRFAWSKYAVPNLQNKEGLPALPFWTGKAG